MVLQLLRHATLLIEIGELTILVDPMLSPAQAADPIADTPNQRRNPLVPLPFGEGRLAEILASLDLVVVSHLHSDHWDGAARGKIGKTVRVVCQPEDAGAIRAAGFGSIAAVEDSDNIGGLQIARTGGRHGSGDLADQIGPVSGFILGAQGEPSIYIAGDTVWCAPVEQALKEHEPDVVVVNAGAAQFIGSDPITMDASDVVRVAIAAPQAKIIAVHMEAINHCLLTRVDLRRRMAERGLETQVLIPADGEQLQL